MSLFKKIIIILIVLAGLIAAGVFLYYQAGIDEVFIVDKRVRVMSTMRSLSTGLEAYKTDNGVYPSYTLKNEEKMFIEMLPGSWLKKMEGLPSFNKNEKHNFEKSFNPGTDVREFFRDEFSPKCLGPYAYYSTKSGWIAWSTGPDLDYDFKYEDAQKYYFPEIEEHREIILGLFGYDPTNGTKSGGDMFRFHQ